MARTLKYSKTRLQESARRGPFVDVLTEFFKHQQNPRAALLVAHGFIELLVNTLINARCNNARTIAENERDFSHSAKLVLLHEIGAIDHDWYARLNLLRKIRNRAAHDPSFEVNNQDLTVYNLPKQILELEGGRPRFPASPAGRNQRFFATVNFLLGDFWNMNSKIFSPVFGEEIAAQKSTAAARSRRDKPDISGDPQ